jgi:uncharacterized membrane protein
MSRQNDELERLRRLRERQLSDRDPTARDRAFQQQISARRRGKQFTLRGLIQDFQSKWTWMMAGGIIGAVAAIVLMQFVQATWAEYVAFVLVVFGIVLGRVFGAIRDWGDEDWGR